MAPQYNIWITSPSWTHTGVLKHSALVALCISLFTCKGDLLFQSYFHLCLQGSQLFGGNTCTAHYKSLLSCTWSWTPYLFSRWPLELLSPRLQCLDLWAPDIHGLTWVAGTQTSSCACRLVQLKVHWLPYMHAQSWECIHTEDRL